MNRATTRLAIGLALLVASLRLVTSEMFLDGVTYAAVARNLAEGRGRFWAPHYTAETGVFVSHPPFALWLESLAFRVFGDHAWVERAYGLAMGAATVWLVAAVWNATRSPNGAGGGWPALLVLATPLVSWCWTNNMLENTLVPLLLASTWLSLRSVRERRFGFALAAGAVGFMAFCTKGPAAIFVLAIPLLRQRRAWTYQAFVLLGFGGVFALAALSPDARELASQYWQKQFVPSLFGERESSSRFLVIGILVRELLLPVLLLIAMGARPTGDRARARFFGECAAAAALPYLASEKQMEWYAVPALVFAALALAALTEPAGMALEARPNANRLALVAGSLGLVLLVLASNALDVSIPVALRDRVVAGAAKMPASEHFWRDFRRDVLLPKPDIRGVLRLANPTDFYRHQAFAQRYLHVTVSRTQASAYVLVDRSSNVDPEALAGCDRRTDGERFTIYSCAVSRNF